MQGLRALLLGGPRPYAKALQPTSSPAFSEHDVAPSPSYLLHFVAFPSEANGAIHVVFLSSTAKDLQPWRDAVAKAISKLNGFHCVRMEGFGAVDEEPLEACRRKVKESDVFVGLVGHLVSWTSLLR